MLADAGGEPLHTRSMTLEVRAAEAGRVAVRGEVIDLRKRGLVPVPHRLQLPGVIHRMELEAEIDAAEQRVLRVESRQPVVAFEPSEQTGGESCRDPAGSLQALVGARLGGEYLRRLSGAYGGPRGCTHLLTLARLLTGGAARALELEAAQGGAARAPGERIFRRTVVLDGFETRSRTMQLAVQLSDVHVRPAAAPTNDSLDQLATHGEVRVLAELELATTVLRALRAEERVRTRSQIRERGFVDRSAALADLVDRPLLGGLAGELVRRLADDPGSAPLLDALLSLAPGYIQCVAAVSELFVAGPRSAALFGAQPDSCFMWRSGGALGSLRPPQV